MPAPIVTPNPYSTAWVSVSDLISFGSL